MAKRPDPDESPKAYAAQVMMDRVDAALRWQDPRRNFSRYLDESAPRHDSTNHRDHRFR